jgi:hypothetical protein
VHQAADVTAACSQLGKICKCLAQDDAEAMRLARHPSPTRCRAIFKGLKFLWNRGITKLEHSKELPSILLPRRVLFSVGASVVVLERLETCEFNHAIYYYVT